MDGAENVRRNETDFDVQVFGNPLFHFDETEIKDYVAVWPCPHDHITVQV